MADSHFTEANGTKFMYIPPDETVYSIWIGTNDLGSFVTDLQQPGANIADHLDCVFAQLQKLYDQGGRYFVVQNNAPLNLAAMYSLPSAGGVGTTTNKTATSFRMLEACVTSNEVYEYRTPYLAKLSETFSGAHFALMDMHALITDMYTYPEQYLNGTAPVNVTGFIHHCSATNHTDCVNEPSPDSFLYYDALHHSEQAVRTFARVFDDVVKGTSRWAGLLEPRSSPREVI